MTDFFDDLERELRRAHRRDSERHPSSRVFDLRQRLPADQRAAIEARVVDGQEYEQIAAAAQTSEAVIRQRVSRGLTSLRRKLGEPTR